MPDYASRKRHKKKVLDRWENEGGRLCDAPPVPADGDAAGKPGERKTGDSPASSKDDIDPKRNPPD